MCSTAYIIELWLLTFPNSCLAYDPIQSLLAVGTTEWTHGTGQVYVFGQSRVQVVFNLPRRASVKILQFCADRLICVDSKNELIIWSLEKKKKLTSYSSPAAVTCLVTDPMLDWAFIGMTTGEVVAYDLDREKLAPLRLPNFWRQMNQRSRLFQIVSMQLHPRDIGQLLIGYQEGAVIYSFKQNKPLKSFHYEVPPGAPGGTVDPITQTQVRTPLLKHVVWHPTGTFILTAHDDGSLVFWDPKDGRVVMARTLADFDVDKPGVRTESFGNTPGTFSLKDPFERIAWCCKENPDDTGILIAGGAPNNAPEKGLTFIELGATPVYATSSWQVLNEHFRGKRQHLLRTPPGTDIVDFCLAPRTSPHFAGAQDPIAILTMLSSGELVTLSFPSGHPISPTNQLHPSVSFVQPFVTSVQITTVERGRWLGMVENRQKGPSLLTGGAEATKPLKRFERRNILQVAHGDGTIRIWDAGQVDQIENPTVLQVDVARALDRFDDVNIMVTSMGSVTGELCVGTGSGEVVVYRWGSNPTFGREAPSQTQTKRGGFTDISSRTEPTLKEGLQPWVLYDMAQGSISALKMSNIGFIGVGSDNGTFSIIDLRGPAVIHTSSIADLSKNDKRGFRKNSVQSVKPDYAVVIEFGVLTLDGDNYSSIACFVGSNMGKVATFKILPQANGGYTAQLNGVTSLSDRIISINPIVADTGKPAAATGAAVAGLRNGEQTHGTLVVGKALLIHPPFPTINFADNLQPLRLRPGSLSLPLIRGLISPSTMSSVMRQQLRNLSSMVLRSSVSLVIPALAHIRSQHSRRSVSLASQCSTKPESRIPSLLLAVIFLFGRVLLRSPWLLFGELAKRYRRAKTNYLTHN